MATRGQEGPGTPEIASSWACVAGRQLFTASPPRHHRHRSVFRRSSARQARYAATVSGAAGMVLRTLPVGPRLEGGAMQRGGVMGGPGCVDDPANVRCAERCSAGFARDDGSLLGHPSSTQPSFP